MTVVQVGNDHGAAERPAEVVLAAGGARSGIRLMRIQRLVGEAVENPAVILVRARLGGEVIDAALGLAELGPGYLAKLAGLSANAAADERCRGAHSLIPVPQKDSFQCA